MKKEDLYKESMKVLLEQYDEDIKIIRSRINDLNKECERSAKCGLFEACISIHTEIISKKEIENVILFFDIAPCSLPNLVSEAILQASSHEVISIAQANQLLNMTLDELKSFITTLSGIKISSPS